MGRSFDLVDFKVAEADFFLERLDCADLDLFVAQWYFSAFVGAARSITFCLQAVLRDVPDFNHWYASTQDALRGDKLAVFFVDARNLGQKVGVTPLRSGASCRSEEGERNTKYFFAPCKDFQEPPEADVVSACRQYLTLLIEIVFECYERFGPLIDPHQHYTQEHFARQGRSIEDAEEELFGVRGWTEAPGIPLKYRWQMLRDGVPGYRVDDLFEKYLKRSRPTPERLKAPPSESITLPTGWRREGGWILPPDVKDIDSYLDSLQKAKNAEGGRERT